MSRKKLAWANKEVETFVCILGEEDVVYDVYVAAAAIDIRPTTKVSGPITALAAASPRNFCLNPYSYDESCVSSSVDHLPLAALPLLAIASPRYLDAVATVIVRANQVYQSFLHSEDGQGFTGQVCLIGDCVGGVLCFDALCFSHQRAGSPGSHQRAGSPSSSRNNSTESLKNTQGLLGESNPGLSSSKRLSKSNIDISAPTEGNGPGPRSPLSRKQSDSYDGDTGASTGQHHSFFSSLMKESLEVCSSNSGYLVLNPGRFDFDVSDCFLLGCPLGLVLAMRRTVLPTIQVSQLHPACSQVFNLFYPSDPSAARLEPLLQALFHRLPPLAVPRYQRHPLGDGRSALIAAGLTPVHWAPDLTVTADYPVVGVVLSALLSPCGALRRGVWRVERSSVKRRASLCSFSAEEADLTHRSP
ncbi:unnamed protein product [Boreogadus saida]